MPKEHRIMFRADEVLLERIEKLGSKLGLGRGEILRLCVEETVERYLNLKGNLIILERQKWDAIFNMFSNLFRKDMLQHVRKMQEESQQKITNKIMELFKSGELEIVEKKP